MWPERFVLLAPEIGQALGLSHRGHWLGVEGFIPERAVNGFDRTLLPKRSGLEVAGGGLAVSAPTPEGVGNVRRTVIPADERRWWVEAE